LRDNRFGNTSDEKNLVLNVISDTIDILTDKPHIATKFDDFIKKNQ